MYRIGIDLGGTNIAFGLVSEDGILINKFSIPTRATRTDLQIVDDMAVNSLKLITDNKLKESDIISIGIGSPGTPDVNEGILIYSCNLPFINTNIRKLFLKYTKIPVFLDNDANCAALGENTSGGAKEYKHSITMTIGTGIGGGIIIDGKIYGGFNFAGGELGHHVIVVDGESCNCGRRGCFEAYSSATAIIRDTKKAAIKYPNSAINSLCNGDLDQINAKTAFDAKKLGDPVGTEIVDTFIKYLGEGISNMINIFQPEIILIGGGVSKQGNYLLDPLRKFVLANTYNREGVARTKIEQAKLGNDAGIIGAAMLG